MAWKICIADEAKKDYQKIEGNIKKQVNDTCLSPNERLSYNVYHYDHKDKVFEIAEKYEERMKAKQKQSVLGNLDIGHQSLQEKKRCR